MANGAALAFFAMVGFEDSVNVAEETKEPSRIFPRALFTGLIVAGVIYVLVAITASMVVPTKRLVNSSGPLLEVVTLIAIALVSTTDVEALGATTAALLLAVFAVVNITVLFLRRNPVDYEHYVAPSAIPVVAAIACALLLTRQEGEVLLRGLILLAVGVGLYVLNWLIAGRSGDLKAEELKG